jgi:hypothetical protein
MFNYLLINKNSNIFDFTKLNQISSVSKVALGEVKTKKNIPSLSNDPIAFLDQQFKHKVEFNNSLKKLQKQLDELLN